MVTLLMLANISMLGWIFTFFYSTNWQLPDETQIPHDTSSDILLANLLDAGEVPHKDEQNGEFRSK